MGEPKFTPGPWHPPHFSCDDVACNCASVVCERYAGAIATIHIGNGRPVGDGGNDCPPLEEATANARTPMLTPTTDVVTEATLFRDVFGCDSDDCEWHPDARRRGRIDVCSGEWRREPDGNWRFWTSEDADNGK